MRVAVTGASGFIGGRVACALAAAGHEVWSFGRRAASQLSTNAPNYASWDIAECARDLWHVDAVVHCAALVGQWGSRATYEAINVTGTRHVLDSVSDAARIVYVSSGSVHHSSHLSAYARTKLRGESIVLGAGRSSIVFRPHIVYGPGDTTLWPRVRAARHGARLMLPGDGRNRVSVTHVDNLVHAIEQALSTHRVNGVFDVADREAPAMQELLETMFSRHGESVHVSTVPRPVAWAVATACEAAWTVLRRSTDPPLTRYLVQNLADPFTLDIEPARRQLGYEPRHTFRDGPL